MLREKLFLSIIFLVLSMMGGLACLPLFVLFTGDVAKANQLGTSTLLILPVISLGLLWSAKLTSVYALRRNCFIAWAVILMTLGITNLILIKAYTDSHSTIIMLGVVCAIISLHAHKKDKKRMLSST
jgi:hypothetical protein